MSLGGTIHATDVLNLTIADPSLAGSPITLSHTVVAGDTDTTIAADFAAQVATGTHHTAFANAGITATSSGYKVTLVDKQERTTTVSKVPATASETLTIGLKLVGGASGFSPAHKTFTSNIQVLQQAWPYYYVENAYGTAASGGACGLYSTCWFELFAEHTAVIAGKPMTGQSTPDAYPVNFFKCSQAVVRSLETTGSVTLTSPYN